MYEQVGCKGQWQDHEEGWGRYVRCSPAPAKNKIIIEHILVYTNNLVNFSRASIYASRKALEGRGGGGVNAQTSDSYFVFSYREANH